MKPLKNSVNSRVAAESLERRELMSAVHHRVRLGSLGDSLTDEYKFYPPDRSHAQNWVQQLAHHGRADFGKLSTKSQGEPRNQGYANNWARSGAVTNDLPAQTAGLAAEVAAGKIDFATVLIGGNDFLHLLATDLITPTAADAMAAALAAATQNVVRNTESAISTLLAASPGVRVMVSTLPALSLQPIVSGAESSPGAVALADQFNAAEVIVNDALTTFAAASDHIGIADFAATAQAFADGGFTFGKVHLDTTLGNSPRHVFLADAIHPGTVAQGILANTFVDAIDSRFGATIKRLTNHQILVDARLAS